MSKKITIVSVGLRGDVQPLAVLGVALKNRGFDVQLIGAARYADTVRGTGVVYSAVEPDPDELLATSGGRRLLVCGDNPVAFARWMRQVGGPAADRLFRGISTVARPSDCVIYSPLAVPAQSLAEYWDVPSFAASFVPLRPTRHFSPSGLGRSLGPLGNVWSLRLAEQVIWQVFRRRVNAWRTGVLGLSPWPLTGPFGEWRRQSRPTLYCYSPSVLPAPPDWPSSEHVTGYWLPDTPSGWEPPRELAEFLDAQGPPVVYAGFGSMLTDDQRGRHELVRGAFRQAGVRGVLLGDPEVTPSDDLVHVVPSVPHSWLFPRMAAVVHHGGASTVGAGLTAGIPTVVCPHFFDQPFWGSLVHRLGAGPSPIPAPELTTRNLAGAIVRAVNDRDMRRRAEWLGRRLRAESGVETACDIVERSLERARSRVALTS
ncbi:glycosyltransferase [Streptomyces mobaraensis]|uniref:glycosyltransferase n=1 Tax=Streptomyces mobaraensis TaxID=35621 RepID=UPI00331F6A93